MNSLDILITSSHYFYKKHEGRKRRIYILILGNKGLKWLCHGDFDVLGQNSPSLKLNTFVRHEMLIEHLKEDIKSIFEARIYRDQSSNEFSRMQDD